MKNSYFASVVNHIFCYLGDVNDSFVDETLQQTRLTELLHLDLKCHGYERIVFMDYNEGAWFLDAASKELFQGKRSAPRIQSRLNGRLLRSAPAPAQPALPERQDKLTFDIAHTEMIRYIERFMTDASIRTAVILPDGLNMLDYLNREGDHGSMLNHLFKEIAGITELSNSNLLILLFDRAEGLAPELFHARHMDAVWQALQRQAVFHHLPPLSAKEIRLALHNLRLAGVGQKRLKLNSTDLDSMCQMMASKLQWNLNQPEKSSHFSPSNELTATRLTTLMQHLTNRYVLTGRELNLDECQQMCNQDASQSAMDKLEALIGMQALKDKLRTYIRLHARAEAPQPRLRTDPILRSSAPNGPNLHFIITGNKGTGKSTAARLIGEILRDLGLLPSGHMVETRPSALIGEYIGQSEARMRDAIERARGGVLFIDEAYGFASGEREGDSYRKGMVDELVASMTARPGEFAVVLAGYPREMERMLSTVNVGLRERFGNHIHIDDYTSDELAQIFRKMATAKGMTIARELDELLVPMMGNWYADCRNEWANARNVENLVNDLWSQSDGQPLTVESLPPAYRSFTNNLRQADAREKLNRMIGMAGVKQTIRDYENMFRYYDQQKRRNHHFIFAGNPGTGKTTVAELFGDLLKGAGVLKSGIVRKIKASDLLNATDALSHEISLSRDRVLFIDEAYQLLDYPQLITQLVMETEPGRADLPLCVICAGYEEEMRQFLRANAGLESRFDVLHFDNYSPDELMQILKHDLAANYPMIYAVDEDFWNGSLKHFQKHHAQIARLHNGRYIGRYLTAAIKLLFRRFNEEYAPQARPPHTAYRLTARELPQDFV